MLIMSTKKIISFGDSFVFGNELPNNLDGSSAWPGIAARELGCDYQTVAVAGCSNENIAKQIYTYFSNNTAENTLAVINWTWCMRWDFFLKESDCWVTLGPTCVPGKLEHLIGEKKAQDLVSFYQAHLEPSYVWNMFKSLQSIYAVQCWLKHRGILNVQTYMDISMIKDVPVNRVEHYGAYKDQSWPDVRTEQDFSKLPSHILDEIDRDFYNQSTPDYVDVLRKAVEPSLEMFEGKTFLDWSYHKKFPVTNLLHPLTQAHQAASELWHDRYKQLLQI